MSSNCSPSIASSTDEAARLPPSSRVTDSLGGEHCRDDGDAERLVLQPLWCTVLRYSHYTSSPAFPVLIYVVVLLACQGLCTLLDLLSTRYESIKKYKIQDVEMTWSAFRPAFVLTCWNHLLYVLPVSIGQWAWLPDTYLPPRAPTLWEFCWHQYVSLAIVDCEYYVWHVLHHKSRTLYRHIHSLHHQYSSVNSWVTQYSHPWELFSLGFFTTTAPWLLHAHPLTNWSFLPFMLAVSIEDHCGYDLPLMPHRWAPFWGGSLKHDMHHQRPLTNFQPFFNWFDRLFGSEYPAHRHNNNNNNYSKAQHSNGISNNNNNKVQHSNGINNNNSNKVEHSNGISNSNNRNKNNIHNNNDKEQLDNHIHSTVDEEMKTAAVLPGCCCESNRGVVRTVCSNGTTHSNKSSSSSSSSLSSSVSIISVKKLITDITY